MKVNRVYGVLTAWHKNSEAMISNNNCAVQCQFGTALCRKNALNFMTQK